MKREPKKSESLEIRLSHEAKTAFMTACRARGSSASVVLRTFIQRYIASARAPLEGKEELAMLFTRSRLAALAAGAAASLIAGVAFTTPANAAVDARLEAVFDWMDADRDGAISAVEFTTTRQNEAPLGAIRIEVETRTLAESETREQLFHRLDKDRDGKVVLEEIAAECVVRTVVTPAIKAADVDGDHALTEAELAAYLAVRGAAAGQSNPARAAAMLARAIAAEHDGDKDGKIVPEDVRS